MKFSHQKVGLPVSYIELGHIGISIHTSPEKRVSCAVFHDQKDGAEFGSLLSRELLNAFILTFQQEFNTNSSSHSTHNSSHASSNTGGGGGTGIYAMDNFLEFQGKIADVIRGSVKPLLDQCQLRTVEPRGNGSCVLTRYYLHFLRHSICSCPFLLSIFRLLSVQDQRGIALVLLSTNPSHDNSHDSNPSTSLQYSTQEVDKLAVLANHQALMGVATDISQWKEWQLPLASAVLNRWRRLYLLPSNSLSLFFCFLFILVSAQNDTANSVILRSRRTTLILLRVERSSLIVVFKNSVDATVCLNKIEQTADIVRKGEMQKHERNEPPCILHRL